MRTALPFLLLLLAGCMDLSLDNGAYENDLDSADGSPDDALRLDIFPPSEDVLGARLAPITVSLADFDLADPVDVTVPRAIDVSGTVTGYAATPWAFTGLPGETVVIADALVRFHQPQTIQSPIGTTDADGHFDLGLAPSPDPYRVTVTPPTGDMPFAAFDQVLSTETDEVVLPVDLGLGVAIWGTVVDKDGDGIRKVKVHAEDGSGAVGGEVVTDETGRYLLRVQPGAVYYVVATGRDNLDPVLTYGPAEVDDEGLQLDPTYVNLDWQSASGRIVDSGGSALPGVGVRFTSSDLDGYDDVAAEHVVEVTTNDGVFSARLLAGRYQAEVLPVQGDAHSPLDLGEIVVVDDDVELGDIPLQPLVPVSGQVVDFDGEGVPQAVVSGSEIGFGQRSWTTSTDELGNYTMALPNVALQYTLRSTEGLPVTRQIVENGALQSPTLTFAQGFVVGGTITWDNDGENEPLQTAIVQVRRVDGSEAGTAVTDADGAFSLVIAPEE